jgi:hypothetical protein
MQDVDIKEFTLKNLNNIELKQHYQVKISKRSASLGTSMLIWTLTVLSVLNSSQMNGDSTVTQQLKGWNNGVRRICILLGNDSINM